MKRFSDLGVAVKKSFVGPSILIEEILGKEIIVEGYAIKPSIKKQDENCLHLQIKYEDQQRVMFSGSTYLMDMIKAVADHDFPFATRIVKVNRHFEFT